MISSPSVAREQLQSAAALLLSVLRAARSLPSIPRAISNSIATSARHLPPQTASMRERSRFVSWIDAAAVLESQGLWQASWDLLHLLLELTGDDTADDVSRRAFLHARLGRVARVAGNVEDAEEWYRDAYRISLRLPSDHQWDDARPHALLGLCILSVGRGNYAKGKSFAMRVLRAQAPALYQVQAHLVLALIERKQGRLNRALEMLWNAFDLIPADDVRQIDILITLAETATELQQPWAAVRARLAALALARTPRHAAAALSGLLAIAADMLEDRELSFVQNLEQSAWGHALSARFGAPPSREQLLIATQEWVANPDDYGFLPHDVIMLHIGAVRLALSMPDVVIRANIAWAEQALELIEDLAKRHSYNERLFELDALRSSLDEWQVQSAAKGSEVDRSAVVSPREEGATRESTHRSSSHAVTRLLSEQFVVSMDRYTLLR